MTTVQTMLTHRISASARRGRFAAALALIVPCLILCGCSGKRQDVLVPPQPLVAPYDSSRGDVLWAVAPLVNESGVGVADPAMIADALIARIEEARGLSCLPLNRSLEAMRARGLKAVRSPQEARTLAEALGVDAIVVGTITSYDPYDPPKLGLTLALYARSKAAGVPETRSQDPMSLRRAFTDQDGMPLTQFRDKPVSISSQHLDAANHEVLLDLKRYASGRHNPDDAMGWRKYTASMDLYTEFAAYHAVGRLLQEERLRLAQPGGMAAANEQDSPR